MLTINDIGLALPTPEIDAVLGRTLPLDRIMPLVRRSWPGPAGVFVAQPVGFRPQPPLRLGTFTWPLGASRWAQGAFLVDKERADAIRDLAFGSDGTELNTVTLKLSSPDAATGDEGEVLETEVYVIAIIPLNRVVPGGGGESTWGMFLLLVADERIYWWDYPTPDFSIDETGNVSWLDVFGMIGTALDIDIDVGTIDPAYLKPSRALNLTYESLPLVLDAAAFNVGGRVIRSYAGDVMVQMFQDALNSYNQELQDHPERVVVGGDARFLDTL
jgi:hypothetical protein